ncbi:RecQ family ATP-dependent DNA helicase [Bacteroides heparinolyticus]|uniref:RecQ family ATP-dependent DNA helicase n=1 Tax=Prevotella heparinolytica TaxID=28113 RepID=UPI0035A1C810
MNKSNFASRSLWEKRQEEVSSPPPCGGGEQREEASEPRFLLRQYWGYTSFRGIQEDIINSILAGKDTLGLMPTGGGKSITFQVPALAQEGLCLVITPLIALMKDQVQNLKKRGIKALAIYSGMSRQEIIVALENCIFGNFKFLYISPERLDTDIFRSKVQKMKISMITVDESHCISQWGYDFRPAYLKIAEIRKLLPGIPVLALTATATPEVIKDIQKRLNFREENVFRMSFERQNLAYIVRKTENKTGELLHILRRMSGSAIIYVRNRRRTKEITELLHNEHITADFYHAGLDDATKDIRQQRWQTGESRVMVATNAFGMGIDKPDVRIVVHMDLPDSIEAYFQEAGRAGRDGKKAYAVILYAKSDHATLHKRIPDSFPEKEYIKDVYEHLQYYYQMAMGDGQGCVREFNIEDFCRKFKYFPVPVDSALKILTQAGYLEYTDEQDNASRLLFTIRRDELYKLKEMDEETDKLIQIILRSYTGIFTDYAFINEDSLATRSGLMRRQVYELLIHLAKLRIVSYIPRKKTPYIIYARERVEKHHLQIPPSVYEERKARYEKRIAAMLDYAGNATTCRSRMLLRYFGEKNEHNCGQCDTCISLKKEGGHKDGLAKELVEDVLRALSEQAMTPAALSERLSTDKETLTRVLHGLLDEGRVIAVNGMLEVKK